MQNTINIGDLDTLITVKRPTFTVGTQGEKIVTYAEHSRVYAKIDKTVDERVDASNLASAYLITATVYKIADLTTRWRVEVGGKPYEITGIDTVSRWPPLCLLTLSAIDG